MLFQRKGDHGTADVESVKLPTRSDDTDDLEAEALALTRAGQAVRRCAAIAPPDSYVRKWLTDLADDLERGAEASRRILSEALAKKEAIR